VTLVFAHLPLEDRGDLAKLVAEHCHTLEEGLRIVAQRVDGSKFGPMDLLAVDLHLRPVIIDVSPQEGDQLLLEGLAHLGWFRRNRQQITHLLGGQKVNLDFSPRLILVARDFSDGLREAMDGLETMTIELFRFRWLEAGEQKGLLLEAVFAPPSREKMDRDAESPTFPPSEGRVPLAEEEIAAFMEMSPRFTL
jgi:hypothetical protein